MRYCAAPGCRAVVPFGRCIVHRRLRDVTREAGDSWRRLYRSTRWRALRLGQLREFPLCQDCAVAGRCQPAVEVHHIEKVRANPTRFFDGPFLSLCRRCHQARTARGE